MLEQPEAYHHPEATGTNPYWAEEIEMGPGPAPRRARRTGTGSTRCITTAGTQSSILSKGGSSVDADAANETRLSDDTLEDENWNRKRYQREDEKLWGHDEPSLEKTGTGSSGGFQIRRPGTSRSGSYYSARAPPVNELHPPVVSLPSPDPAENRWMLQPPPKASVMSGKERASTRSRSGSGASSRVELSLGRQVSTRQMMHKLEREITTELPSISPVSSYGNLVSGQRRARSRTPQARPPSSASSRRKRRDTAMTRTDTLNTQHSSGDSSDTITLGNTVAHSASVPDITVIRIRETRPGLSTIVSSGSDMLSSLDSNSSHDVVSSDENTLPSKPLPIHTRLSSKSQRASESKSYLMRHRTPLNTSDVSSLNCLQDLVSPRALLDSRFVSAPLVEAKIRLPPSEEDMSTKAKSQWTGNGFGVSREWGANLDDEDVRVPFDRLGPGERDPRLRWSVDF